MEDNKTTLDTTTADPISKTSVKQVSLKWGLILGVISVAFFIITIFGGLVGNQVMSFIGYVPTIIIIVLAHKEFKNDGTGYMSYGQGLGIGTLISLISAVISMAFFYVYVKFVDGSFIDIIKEQQVQDMMDKGMSSEQIDQATSVTENFMTPEMMTVFGIVIAVFGGFIVSLIISAFTKKSNPEFDM